MAFGLIRARNCGAAVVSSLLIITGAVGCVSAGGSKRITDAALVSQVKEGKTAKDEVRSLLGGPNHVHFDADDEIWTYNYCKTTLRATNWIPYVNMVAGGYDSESASVTVVFDSRGVVKHVGRGTSTGGGGGIQDLGR